MDLSFERGDSQRPKGHALIYFRVNTEPDKVYATYVVILPVKSDLSKYVPPFLATHLGSVPLSDFSAFAMPPVPEPVDSYQELDRLSKLRDDDLVYGDSMFSFDLPRMMEAVTEAVQSYSQLCNSYFSSTTPHQALSPELSGLESEGDTSFQVNEVLFGLMSEGDKLAELSRLLGKLRFAQEGQDLPMLSEVTQEIKALARHLPEEFRVSNLLAAAQDASRRGARLAQLYLDRCFRLSAGDTGRAEALEKEIQSLTDQGQ
jgi:hypothetical protein